MVQMKIKTSSLLMEAGVSYNKQKLHKAGYFRELLATNPDIDEGALPAASVPGDGGAPGQNGECSDPFPAARPIAGRTCGAADEYPGDWADHSADLGIGNR